MNDLQLNIIDLEGSNASALVTGRLEGSIRAPGADQPQEGPWRLTAFQTKQSGTWKISHCHFPSTPASDACCICPRAAKVAEEGDPPFIVLSPQCPKADFCTGPYERPFAIFGQRLGSLFSYLVFFGQAGIGYNIWNRSQQITNEELRPFLSGLSSKW